MTSKPKISIIIPVFNCENLVSFTLNSLLKQTFVDWECILIDDNSTDNVFLVLQEYQKKDDRFKVFRKPLELKQGANVSRNFGFLKAKGSYIKWFDCDDIMLPAHLEMVYEALLKNNLDFVVTDTFNFNDENGELICKPYNFDREQGIISAENLALNRIGWVTDDFIGKRELLEKINFNENITSIGDEYNFFVRFLHHTVNGALINEVLTHRRLHNNSIIYNNGEHTKNYAFKVAIVKFQTAKDLMVYNDVELIRWFLSGYMQYAFKLAIENEKIPFWIPAFKLICTYYSFRKGCAFIIALSSARSFGKGYNIMKYARK